MADYFASEASMPTAKQCASVPPVENGEVVV